jgi:endo-alpha-1,4-polygalactosaminidase (GH114 family)
MCLIVCHRSLQTAHYRQLITDSSLQIAHYRASTAGTVNQIATAGVLMVARLSIVKVQHMTELVRPGPGCWATNPFTPG